MTITRDSTLLWLGIAGAVVVYLGASPSPMTWSWADWMQFAAFAIGVLSAKLATSPLPGSKDTEKINMAGRLPMVVLPFVLAVMLPACAAPVSVKTPEGQAAWAADQVVQRVGELQAMVIQLERTGGMTTAEARVVVQWTVAASKVLKEAPAGRWKMLWSSYLELRQALPPGLTPPVLTSLAVMEGMLRTLCGEACQ